MVLLVGIDRFFLLKLRFSSHHLLSPRSFEVECHLHDRAVYNNVPLSLSISFSVCEKILIFSCSVTTTHICEGKLLIAHFNLIMSTLKAYCLEITTPLMFRSIDDMTARNNDGVLF